MEVNHMTMKSSTNRGCVHHLSCKEGTYPVTSINLCLVTTAIAPILGMRLTVPQFNSECAGAVARKIQGDTAP